MEALGTARGSGNMSVAWSGLRPARDAASGPRASLAWGYNAPLVEGTPLKRGSGSTAMRRARPKALNRVST